jgi:Carboxypeptidase regulatory-like domain
VKKVPYIFVLALIVLSAVVVFAQESAVKGNLGGIVVDSTGALVQKAKVTLTGPTGTKSATSDSLGRFTFDLLTPGIYAVSAEMTGFKTVEVKGVEVYTNKTSSVRLTLEPGTAKETIEVSGAAVTVDTTSTATGENLNDAFYSRVPLGRNVTSIFYASPGVNYGGTVGPANPSISGGSGLENQYVADGVNITDGAFGGIGVYTVNYGSLSTGINLSFVKEVQVKTAGYEPQYGKSTGGLIQIVTKSGSNEFHGGVAGFWGPQQFEAERLQPDNFGRLNEQGRVLHNGSYDVSGELGGYVPRFKDRLFFFGSFNPSWTRQYNQLSDLHGTFAFPLVASKDSLTQLAYNYAAKLTWKISDRHQVESSVFGDPTRSNFGPFQTLETFSDTTFSKLSNGTRNWVARYNTTLSPSWLFNASFSWGHNYLTETPHAPNIYQVSDFTGCGFTGTALIVSSSCRTQLTPGTLSGPNGPLSGLFVRQGLGFYENTEGDNHTLNFDTQKIVNKLGSHTFGVGYHYEWSSYAGARFRTGPRFTITPKMATAINFAPALGLTSNAAGFSIRLSPSCAACPVMTVPGLVGDKRVILRQVRGEFGDPTFDTNGRYHAAYVNDAWSINRYVTVDVGWRWEQQLMQGSPFINPVNGNHQHTHYTFTDNWSPRIGLAIDPKGDRKTKVSGNFARYSYAIPLDLAIRSLSNELDFATTEWFPVSSGGRVVTNPDGTIANPILDDAHFRRALTGISSSLNPDGSVETIAPGTKMQYLQEWTAGVEHEFPKGFVVDVRWVDRRIKRIVEDVAGISPEAFQAGLNQIYTITNPTAKTDLYTNPVQVLYPPNGGASTPAACPSSVAYGGVVSIDPVLDTFGNSLGAMCIANPDVAGTLHPDGKPDGFVNPARKYKAIEFEANKAFSRGWQVRSNYRWSQLSGNYEGAFRNDNGQSDPNISSLFDFIQGDFNLLGQQFAVGWLNTDRRHIFNNFISYTFSSSFLRNLTLGTGVRVESGVPINDLKAHPAYQNAGEIPVGRRGLLGRTSTDGQADVHADYALKVAERHTLHFGADMFNITNQTTQLRVDQNEDRQFGVANADFKKPTQGNLGFSPSLGFQRPFYARVFVRWEF